MQPSAPGTALAAEDVRAIAARTAATRLLQAKLDEALRAPPGAPLEDAPNSAADPPSLTVAVCTKGRPRMLARCLEALYRTRRSDGAALGALLARDPERYEVLVIDNAPSDDRNLEVVDAFASYNFV